MKIILSIFAMLYCFNSFNQSKDYELINRDSYFEKKFRTDIQLGKDFDSVNRSESKITNDYYYENLNTFKGKKLKVLLDSIQKKFSFIDEVYKLDELKNDSIKISDEHFYAGYYFKLNDSAMLLASSIIYFRDTLSVKKIYYGEFAREQNQFELCLKIIPISDFFTRLLFMNKFIILRKFEILELKRIYLNFPNYREFILNNFRKETLQKLEEELVK